MRYFCFLLLISPYLIFSQQNCENQLKEVKVNLTSGQEIWKFCGELDDNGDPSGTGVFYADKYIEEGTFKRGELDGTGKRIWNDKTQYDEGVFSKGSFISGKRILKYDDSKIVFKGDFKENQLHDKDGFYELIQSDGTKITKTGKFIKGTHITGEESTSYSSGLEIISNYEDGELIGLPLRNDTNYYNQDDIIGEKDFIEIELDKQGNINSGISYNVKLTIDGVEGEWLFDTGAMGFSIGKRMFERLKTEGIKYRDLNQKVSSYGIMEI
ncbi:MAG: retropepsin-like aspartic protease [Bacteroidota bacterium]|nr:retropepsin-like aspartic protease [Bacteroidota bacterium]